MVGDWIVIHMPSPAIAQAHLSNIVSYLAWVFAAVMAMLFLSERGRR